MVVVMANSQTKGRLNDRDRRRISSQIGRLCHYDVLFASKFGRRLVVSLCKVGTT
jgi:hypothetical protein